MQEIKRNCSPLAHLPASNIRVRYRDEDSDMINLWDDSSGFSFGEMLRSDKEVKERDYKKKIFLQASEIDSTLPRKMRRTDLGMPSSEADNESLPPKHLSFTPDAARPATTTGNRAEKSPLDFQRQEIEENVQILKVQVASAKDELEKLNCESRNFQCITCTVSHVQLMPIFSRLAQQNSTSYSPLRGTKCLLLTAWIFSS